MTAFAAEQTAGVAVKESFADDARTAAVGLCQLSDSATRRVASTATGCMPLSSARA